MGDRSLIMTALEAGDIHGDVADAIWRLLAIPRCGKLQTALERIIQDADLEDEYNERDSDGRFISKEALVNARQVLSEIKYG